MAGVQAPMADHREAFVVMAMVEKLVAYIEKTNMCNDERGEYDTEACMRFAALLDADDASTLMKGQLYLNHLSRNIMNNAEVNYELLKMEAVGAKAGGNPLTGRSGRAASTGTLAKPPSTVERFFQGARARRAA